MLAFDHLTTNRATVPSLVSGFSLFFLPFLSFSQIAVRLAATSSLLASASPPATRLSPLGSLSSPSQIPCAFRYFGPRPHFRPLSSSELTAGLHQPSSFHCTVPPLTMSGVSHVCPGTKKTRNKQHRDGGCGPCRIEVAWRRSLERKVLGTWGTRRQVRREDRLTTERGDSCTCEGVVRWHFT